MQEETKEAEGDKGGDEKEDQTEVKRRAKFENKY